MLRTLPHRLYTVCIPGLCVIFFFFQTLWDFSFHGSNSNYGTNEHPAKKKKNQKKIVEYKLTRVCTCSSSTYWNMALYSFFSQDVAVFAIWICLCWYSSLDIWHFFFSLLCVFRIYRWFNSCLHYNFKAEIYYLTSCFVQLVCFLSALCSVLILIVIFA